MALPFFSFDAPWTELTLAVSVKPGIDSFLKPTNCCL